MELGALPPPPEDDFPDEDELLDDDELPCEEDPVVPDGGGGGFLNLELFAFDVWPASAVSAKLTGTAPVG